MIGVGIRTVIVVMILDMLYRETKFGVWKPTRVLFWALYRSGTSSHFFSSHLLLEHKKRDKKGWVYFNWAVLRKHDQRDKKRWRKRSR